MIQSAAALQWISVESNTGRRLGAASYRIGAFLDGKKELNSQTNFVYSAAVAEHDAQRGAVRDLVTRFFKSSPERLVLTLLRHNDVTPAELRRLRRMVDEEKE